MEQKSIEQIRIDMHKNFDRANTSFLELEKVCRSGNGKLKLKGRNGNSRIKEKHVVSDAEDETKEFPAIQEVE